jgi:hypothetical protein
VPSAADALAWSRVVAQGGDGSSGDIQAQKSSSHLQVCSDVSISNVELDAGFIKVSINWGFCAHTMAV